VERLAARYIDDHLSGLSVRFRKKQTYPLRRWALPRLDTFDGVRAGLIRRPSGL
jgi:hypothetical protein